MYLGYNTNGLAHHDLLEAVALLAGLGYRGVAVTIDQHALNPGEADRAEQLERLRERLELAGMRSVIETGARYLLDPKQKHEPTLISPEPEGRARRLAFLEYAVDCAAALGSDCVSLFSGRLREGVEPKQAIEWLVDGLRSLLEYAHERGVDLGFEPEPDMLIDSMFRFEQLLGKIDDRRLRLTLDVGHLHCQGETPVSHYLHLWASRLVNVHLEDMRAGRHEHLMFGEGEIEFPPVFTALREIGYKGGVYVELPGHSREAPEAARRAMGFLRPLLTSK
ncbi:MAG: sugar phosphate isomerase/epimerase [Pirellulales bacterium]|nr:sugar phosphate isomerase/epimerase [Pirellulales bacterium]